MIAPVLQIAARQGRALRQIKLQLLAAAAHKRLGDRLVAHRRLAAALDLAAPGNCRQSFLDEGDEILELLDAHRESVRSAPEGSAAAARRRFIEALRPDAVGREAGRGALGGPPERSAARIELTDREKEVLIMVGNSMTNVEIARATFVTQDTVKYHLKNIYAKVGARNRIHAVRIAQDRGYC